MILIIDNYDSFTFNLARYFEELGQIVKVIKNDELSFAQLRQLDFSHLVISPGPCTPNESGICLQAIEQYSEKVPILGVCLGHQAIAQVFGAKIIRAKHVLHGKTSTLQRTDEESRLFIECPKTFQVTRYHSLLVDETSLPAQLKVTAISTTFKEREIMAIESLNMKLFGLQFHPESLLTEYGHQVLSNFLNEGSSH